MSNEAESEIEKLRREVERYSKWTDALRLEIGEWKNQNAQLRRELEAIKFARELLRG